MTQLQTNEKVTLSRIHMRALRLRAASVTGRDGRRRDMETPVWEAGANGTYDRLGEHRPKPQRKS
jgi:hypothetical protein